MMSLCLTWVPFSELGEPYIYHQSVCFTRMCEGCGVLSYCEELVGVTHKRWWGWFFGYQILVKGGLAFRI